MLFLDPDTPKFIKARREFFDEMLPLIQQRIASATTLDGIDPFFTEWFFEDYLKDKLHDVLIGKPAILIDIHKKINSLIQFSGDIKTAVHYALNYDWFIAKTKGRYSGYHLADALDVRTCTYCNRNYTNTVVAGEDRKITRPQYDHFFDKATHPLLAISFYNLIPSCSICNSSIKGSNRMNLTEYLHPYIDDAINQIQFTYKYSLETKSGLKVIVKGKTAKIDKTLQEFAVQEVYNSHTGELLDMLRTKQYFSDRYLSILSSNLLKDVIVSKDDLYRMVFGTEFKETNFINRPFSKFKSDILKELGII